jgi:hypothetical protein
MTKDEALRLAWNALQQIAHVSAMDYEYQQWAVEAITAIKEALAQPEQPKVRTGDCLLVGVCASEGHKIAPQRTWVGMTDEDFLEACQIAERGNYLVAFQRIQAKLRSKNESKN